MQVYPDKFELHTPLFWHGEEEQGFAFDEVLVVAEVFVVIDIWLVVVDIWLVGGKVEAVSVFKFRF